MSRKSSSGVAVLWKTSYVPPLALIMALLGVMSLRLPAVTEAVNYNSLAILIANELNREKVRSPFSILDWESSDEISYKARFPLPAEMLSADDSHRILAIGMFELLRCGEGCAFSALTANEDVAQGEYAELLQGFLSFRQGNLTQAMEAWSSMQNGSTILMYMGSRAYHDGDYDQAIVFFDRATKDLTSFRVGHALMLGYQCIIYRDRGELDTSLRWCEENVKVLETSSSWLLLGRTQFEQGQFTLAISSFRNSLELDPNSAPASRWLGDALAEEGRLTEAEMTYLRSIDLDSENGWNKLGLANLYARTERTDEAISLLDELVQHPDPFVRQNALNLLEDFHNGKEY